MRCLDRSAMQSFVDGELDSLSADTIRAHLYACPDCRDAVDAVRRRAQTVRRSLDEAWPVVAAPPLAHAVPPDQRLAAAGAPRSIWRRHLQIPIPLLAAAGLLIAGMGIVIWQQRLIMGELRATRQPPVTTVTIAAGDTILQREIVLDLSRCQPVEDTTVYVFREE
ncbi:MAG TPA: zf-HC2 domain-containing protein [Acidobacteriota bacterium]|nr:zf-HC2 domain-containing protein [Acidobacteriota bacterium]HNR40320.1 zf-HC2 domain-containing protein [Acidobacteriota bacterium]HNU02421.1 zf-HC2 domain-containing protein [Acidobacteriota bacterium]HPB29662.1 zf-HC2 domain-containing protein [Acidobacteriota bacterium]